MNSSIAGDRKSVVAIVLVTTLLAVSATDAQNAWREVAYLDHSRSAFESIAFADSLNEAVLSRTGHRGGPSLWVTANGGYTWEVVFQDTILPDDPSYQPKDIVDIAMPSPSTILMTTDSAMVYRTSDRGATWQLHSMDDYPYRDPGIVDMYSETEGLAELQAKTVNGEVRPDMLVVTHDGGIQWDSVPSPLPDGWVFPLIRDLEMVGPDHFVVFMYRNRSSHSIAVTTNAGESWTYVDNVLGSDSVLENANMQFVRPNTGYLLGSRVQVYGQDTIGVSGIVRKTTDGGMTWQSVYDGFVGNRPLAGFTDVAFETEDTGIAASERKIFRTVDGGRMWTIDTLLDRAEGKKQVAWPKDHSGIVLQTDGRIYVPDETGAVRESRVHGFAPPDVLQDGNSWITKWPKTLPENIESVSVIDALGRTVSTSCSYIWGQSSGRLSRRDSNGHVFHGYQLPQWYVCFTFCPIFEVDEHCTAVTAIVRGL